MNHFTPEVSIVIPAKNEGINVRNTLNSLFSTRTNQRYEVIVVDDGSTDGCCDFIQQETTYKHVIHLLKTNGIGAANARNYGAQYARGQYLVFCDAHLFFKDMWMDRLVNPLKKRKTDAICPGIADVNNTSSVGYGQSLKPNLVIYWTGKPANISDTAVLPGGCFMISKKVFQSVGGFESGFKTWGYEDIELSIKLWLFGYRCSVHPDVKVFHVFRTSHPYQLSRHHLDYNLMRLAYSHFNTTRINKCKRLLKQDPKKIDKLVLRDHVLKQRKAYFQKRKYDDTWYFKRFSIPF